MDDRTIKASIEAVLFVAGDPIPLEDLARALEQPPAVVARVVDEMIDEYNYDMRGIQILKVGGGVQFASRKEYGELVQQVLSPTIRQSLSAAALETLSVVAYMQPITRSEIEQIRGVRCDYAVTSLQQKGLIEAVGVKDALGHPRLYGTTEDFLRVFGLSGLDELPPLNAEDAEGQLELELDTLEDDERPQNGEDE